MKVVSAIKTMTSALVEITKLVEVWQNDHLKNKKKRITLQKSVTLRYSFD